jgi:hypothetical protein
MHGIRDFAYWQVDVRQALEARGFIVELTNYERFDLLRFLAPVPWFRNATMRVLAPDWAGLQDSRREKGFVYSVQFWYICFG